LLPIRSCPKNHAVGWDASRPAPLKRLFREWLIFAPIMAVVIYLLQRDSDGLAGSLVGLTVSLPLYVGLGYVLAKFGYQRKTLADLRTPRAPTSAATSSSSEQPRPRPAPTRRTSTGPHRSSQKRRR
jgi:hypothetical protein